MKISKYGLLTAAAILTVTFALSSTHTTVLAVTHDNRATTAEGAATERHAAAKEKLSAAKIKACEKHEANINDRMTRISERATKHLDLFTKISERAQAFYVTKGNSLTNYDELVATVNAKKAAAESTVASLNINTNGFTCDGDNPKHAIEEFRTSLKSTVNALKEYRTSVKDLIVGIKSVNGEHNTKANPTKDER